MNYSSLAYSSLLDGVGFVLVAAFLFAPVVYLTGYIFFMAIGYWASDRRTIDEEEKYDEEEVSETQQLSKTGT